MHVSERLRKRVNSDDAGFSILELMIATALTALVSASMMGLLVSQQNAERAVSTYANNQEDLREAMTALQRDLRSAEPLTGVASAPQLKYQVDLEVYENVRSLGPVRVRWRLDAASDELVRETLNSTGSTVVGTSDRLTGVANENVGTPIFAYYKSDGSRYDLDLPGTDSGTVATCTTRVAIDLRAAPHGGSAMQLTSDVQLRNRLPGEFVCP